MVKAISAFDWHNYSSPWLTLNNYLVSQKWCQVGRTFLLTSVRKYAFDLGLFERSAVEVMHIFDCEYLRNWSMLHLTVFQNLYCLYCSKVFQFSLLQHETEHVTLCDLLWWRLWFCLSIWCQLNLSFDGVLDCKLHCLLYRFIDYLLSMTTIASRGLYRSPTFFIFSF